MQDLIRFFDADGYAAQLFSAERYDHNQAEAYYRWWYDWCKHTVENDRELSAAHPELFEHYPVDHHQTPFNERTVDFWGRQTDALGGFVKDALLPQLNEYGQFALQIGHRKLLADIETLRVTPRDSGSVHDGTLHATAG